MLLIREFRRSLLKLLCHIEMIPLQTNTQNVYLFTVSFEIYVLHTPTKSLFINLVKSFKFTLKYTIISLLHVSVFNDHHQGALSVPNESYEMYR